MKLTAQNHLVRIRQRRSPCGERGLKWKENGVSSVSIVSLPVRGAWIEM